ncbi:MAG: hypothetical protein ACKO3N_10550, partial [Verrucomicrobiota bacterium]
GRRVARIGRGAFAGCTNLTGIFFEGQAPAVEGDAFALSPVTLHRLPGTAGWGPTLAGRPTVPWVLPQPVILDGAPGPGGSPAGYGLRISWATNLPVVIEASANLANPEWLAVATNHLFQGWTDFLDPQPANQPQRWYRVGPQRPPASVVLWGDSMVAAGGLRTAIAALLAPRVFLGVSYPGATSGQILARLRQEVEGANTFRGWIHAFFHGTNNLEDADQVRSDALALAELAGAPDHRVLWLSVIGQLAMGWNGNRLVGLQHEPAFQGLGAIQDLERWYETNFPGSLLNCRQVLIDGAPSIPSLHFPGLTEAEAAATYGVLPLSFYLDLTTQPWTPADLTFRGYWRDPGRPDGGTDGDYWLRTGNGRTGALLVRWGGIWTEHVHDLTHLTPAGNAVLARAFVRLLADPPR